MSEMKTLTLQEVQVGDQLPPLTIDITNRLITGAAIASRDFQDVHHDADAARALGSPDIFMNILTTNGLVGRFVMGWAGPNGLLRKVSIKLGVPNYPGDSMVIRGEVTDITDDRILVEVKGKNSLGYHVTGSATLTLPAGRVT